MIEESILKKHLANNFLTRGTCCSLFCSFHYEQVTLDGIYMLMYHVPLLIIEVVDDRCCNWQNKDGNNASSVQYNYFKVIFINTTEREKTSMLCFSYPIVTNSKNYKNQRVGQDDAMWETRFSFIFQQVLYNITSAKHKLFITVTISLLDFHFTKLNPNYPILIYKIRLVERVLKDLISHLSLNKLA